MMFYYLENKSSLNQNIFFDIDKPKMATFENSKVRRRERIDDGAFEVSLKMPVLSSATSVGRRPGDFGLFNGAIYVRAQDQSIITLGAGGSGSGWPSVLEANPNSGSFSPRIDEFQDLLFEAGIKIGRGDFPTGPTSASGINIGNGNTSTGDNSIAIGTGITTSELRSTAIGTGAQAPSVDALAIGSGALASAADAIAIGLGSRAEHAQSVAIGAGATTTGVNQIVLGGGQIVSVTGNLVVLGPSVQLNTIPNVAVPNNANAAGAGVAVGGLYRDQADPATVYQRTA
jgi:hypothetical protein